MEDTSFQVKQAVDSVYHWLFQEGGHSLGTMQELLDGYAHHLESIGISLDRVFVIGQKIHPKAAACKWKWQKVAPFVRVEVPHLRWERMHKLFDPTEPFQRMLAGEEMVRIKAGQHAIPPSCDWYEKEGYQDFVAQQIVYPGKDVGIISWATKDKAGFSDAHVEFFKLTLPVITTVIKLHGNETTMTTLTSKLEEVVVERTRKLAEANADLEKANARIQKHSAAQLRHFAMMSHEIRTPLNCIVAMSSLMMDRFEREDGCNDELRETVRMITQSGALLANVVNDVLDYSRLESGNVDVVLQSTRLRETLNVVIQAMETKCMQRDQRLDYSKIDYNDLPETIHTDGGRLQQCLFNLIGNAIKFSEDGGTIEFYVSRRGSEVLFFVKDTGRGIPSCDLTRIFEPFDQGPKETQHTYGGAGLGLTISRTLTAAMGGTLSASSKVGEWSEFVLSLPAIQTEACDHLDDKRRESCPSLALLSNISTCSEDSEEGKGSDIQLWDSLAPTNEQKACSKVSVLVVDDNVINRKIAKRVLERLDIQHIDIACNGLEAVKLEADNKYDVILMDVEMPVMDGITAAKQILHPIRSRSSVPHIVFVTAHALESFKQDALSQFPEQDVGYMAKPYNLQQMKRLFADERCRRGSARNKES